VVLFFSIVLLLLFSALAAVPMAWVLMLLFGAFSHASGHPEIALSFWACFWLVFILATIGSLLTRKSKE
jgi:hypothetical protein